MKSGVLAAVGLAVVGVAAQSQSTTTVTEYYSSCSSVTETLYTATETGTITQTYCPECEGMTSSGPAPVGTLTTYTTVYTQVCPTGLQPVTYIVTEPCDATSTSRASSYVPQAFTVVTVPCPVCPTPGPVVVTTPIASVAPAPTSGYGTLPAVSVSPASGGASPGGIGVALAGSPAASAPAVMGGNTTPGSGASIPGATVTVSLASGSASPGAGIALAPVSSPATPESPAYTPVSGQIGTSLAGSSIAASSSPGAISPPIQTFSSGASTSSIEMASVLTSVIALVGLWLYIL